MNYYTVIYKTFEKIFFWEGLNRINNKSTIINVDFIPEDAENPLAGGILKSRLGEFLKRKKSPSSAEAK